MMIRALSTVAAALLLWAARSGGAPSADVSLRPAKDSVISIRTFGYQPATLELRAGTAVRWLNLDEIEHTVTSGTPEGRNERFAGTLAAKNATYETTFREPGTYPYFCDRHQFMRGQIQVTR